MSNLDRNAHVAAWFAVRKLQLKATDLQLWTMANLHLIRWVSMTIPHTGPINVPMIGKRGVSSMVRTMRKRRWLRGCYPWGVELTQEGTRVLMASRLNPEKLVWC